jgi:phospholipid/cholesterol/gamma-HCH transport system substrate-binding protein
MNQQQRERMLRFRVGVFVLAGILAFLGMVYLLGARARLFEARYTIHADFTEVGGLAEGATVRLAGVQIGRVTGVHLSSEPGGKVRIDMSIGRQFADRVRKDSIARIDTQGLLGDKIIEVTVGTAQAPSVRAGDVISSRDPTDIGQVLTQGAETVKSVAAVAGSLKEMAEALNRSQIIDDASAAVTATRKAAQDATTTLAEARKITGQVGQVVTQAGRVVDQVEKGNGWAHALIYDEPEALRKINELLVSTQRVLDRIDRGEGAIGVLASSESTAAARRFTAAMARLGSLADSPEDQGVLPGLLFDPKYRSVLDDLSRLTQNLRDVSERVAGGRGTVGGLVRDEPDGGIRQASRDLQQAVANLKHITEKINEGEGTLGALIADPTIYERLVSILDGAQRSFLLRGLLRGLGGAGSDGKGGAANEKGRTPATERKE